MGLARRGRWGDLDAEPRQRWVDGALLYVLLLSLYVGSHRWDMARRAEFVVRERLNVLLQVRV